MLQNHLRAGAVGHRRSLNILHAANLHNLCPQHSGRTGNSTNGQHQNALPEARTNSAGHSHVQNHAGDRLDYIRKAHDNLIHNAAEITGQRTEEHAHHRAKQGCADTQRQRIPGAIEQTAENISADLVRTAQMLPGGALVGLKDVQFCIVIGGNPGCTDGQDHQCTEDDHADHGRGALAQPLP